MVKARISCERVVVGSVQAHKKRFLAPGDCPRWKYCCTALMKYQHLIIRLARWKRWKYCRPQTVMVRSSPSQACSNSFPHSAWPLADLNCKTVTPRKRYQLLLTWLASLEIRREPMRRASWLFGSRNRAYAHMFGLQVRSCSRRGADRLMFLRYIGSVGSVPTAPSF